MPTFVSQVSKAMVQKFKAKMFCLSLEPARIVVFCVLCNVRAKILSMDLGFALDLDTPRKILERKGLFVPY